LTPLVDYADLDGSILTKNDPYRGATFERGRIGLPTDPGLGVDRR
jgi:L-alanine-DL-glutamate epimerase-like enolase superfamily enzyme